MLDGGCGPEPGFDPEALPEVMTSLMLFSSLAVSVIPPMATRYSRPRMGSSRVSVHKAWILSASNPRTA